MHTIHKTTIAALNLTEVRVPSGAKFISVQTQHSHCVAWFECDSDAPLVTRRILVTGTGIPIPSGLEGSLRHIDTFQVAGGEFVLHAFEVLSEAKTPRLPVQRI